MTRCNITSSEEATGVLSDDGHHPLTGIMHAGGVLVDGTLLKQTAASLRGVLAPKLAVMPSIRRGVLGQPIVDVNLFSSVSAFLGSPGQANYAAANMALNSWAHALQSSGIAGQCVGDANQPHAMGWMPAATKTTIACALQGPAFSGVPGWRLEWLSTTLLSCPE